MMRGIASRLLIWRWRQQQGAMVVAALAVGLALIAVLGVKGAASLVQATSVAGDRISVRYISALVRDEDFHLEVRVREPNGQPVTVSLEPFDLAQLVAVTPAPAQQRATEGGVRLAFETRDDDDLRLRLVVRQASADRHVRSLGATVGNEMSMWTRID